MIIYNEITREWKLKDYKESLSTHTFTKKLKYPYNENNDKSLI